MRQKMDEEESKNTTMFNDLQKASLQMFKKLNEDIERARKQRQMKLMLSKKLQ